jgi:putative salt-induced outer membrane protein YdiY
MPRSRVLQCAGVLALVFGTTTAHAQTPAPSLTPITPDRPVAVPITQFSQAPATRPPVPNRIAANVSVGTALNGGNTRSYAGTLGGRFLLTRFPHQVTVEALGNWTKSRVTQTDSATGESTQSLETTASNILAKARYDIFLAKNDALFVAMAPRNDRFAGLDMRLQNQAGYLRNLYVPADNHRLWLEVGYDGTYDNIHLGPVGTTAAVPAGTKEIDFVHSARVFVGYSNALTQLATLNVGVESLFDVEDKNNTRVNAVAELTSSLSQRFKLSIQSRLLYDQTPVQGKEKTDYITTAQLVFSFDTFTPPPACPACDCSAEVAQAKASCAAPASGAVPAPEDPTMPPAPLPAYPKPG